MDTRTLENDLATLTARKEAWAALPLPEKTALLRATREGIARVADRWVAEAVRAKGIPEGSPLAGEEWLSGPYSVLAGLVALESTLEKVARGESPVRAGAVRTRPDGRVTVDVYPVDAIDRILLSGVTAQVWMEPGVTAAEVPGLSARRYREPPRPGRVALVLGAGNISSIAPLDALHELYAEGAVALVKMNPVNGYLGPLLEEAFAPFVAAGFVRFAQGGADVGGWLAGHPAVDLVHVTGSERTHDALRYGPGAEGLARKQRGEPVNTRPISAELGGVGPTIVLPGRWSDADLRFQAESVVSQKMHNGGFNCVASQVLVLPRSWPQRDEFLAAVREVFRAVPARHPYYPGAADRQAEAVAAHPRSELLDAPGSVPVPRTLLLDVDPENREAHAFRTEFFGGVLAETSLPGEGPAEFLENAVRFANGTLRGSLGASVLVDPATAASLGPRLEAGIAALRYGSISVNTWTGVAYFIPQATWGAFPGHTDHDIQSGRGVVHNALLLERTERTVVRAPFRPFPRAWLTGDFHLGPKPPWFVTHRTADELGRRLTRFGRDRSIAALPGVVAAALRG